MPHLFEPLTLRGLTLRNRIVVSPMCQYSANEGFVNDWHFVHLSSRAVGGAALVFVEATAVSPEGRISPDDLGLWEDVHGVAFERVVRFVKGEGAAFGVQLAHAGRKASSKRPWDGFGSVPPEEGGWEPIGPGAVTDVETEATVKLWLGDERVVAIGEGNGPVNALDAALRIAVGSRFPALARISLTDFKVRVLDTGKGTGAITRVLLDSTNGEREWTTIGVSENIIEASWNALVDSIVYGLLHTSA